jgi:hypothetical protein
MYLLRDLNAPLGIAGHARAANPDDVGSVSPWLAAFRDEAQPHAPSQDWVTLANQRVAAGQFQLLGKAEGRSALHSRSAGRSGVSADRSAVAV